MDISWKMDSSATVTITHPHLYPDFNTLLQQIADQFKTPVQQQPINQKRINGRNPVRCFFNHGIGIPQKTAQAATMFARATAPITIKPMSDKNNCSINSFRRVVFRNGRMN